MDESVFRSAVASESVKIEKARDLAFSLHEKVGQNYGKNLPYSFHLQMVVDNVIQYGHLVCECEDDVLPMIFSGYFHDTIEDTRHTYNDVLKMARDDVGMTESQAYMAAEIVYALTDEKGRNRDERQSDKYYQGIRDTPYAPFVKMTDRLANTAFSFTGSDPQNMRMREVYRSEFPVFIGHIDYPSDDPRKRIPEVMIQKVFSLFGVME